MRQTRICISVKHRPEEGEENQGKGTKTKKMALHVLPNYPITKGRISEESRLPQEDIYKHSHDRVLVQESEVKHFIQRLKDKFEMVYPSIGQIVTIFVLKTDPNQKAKPKLPKMIDPGVATCSLAQINSDINTLFGTTCIHAFRTDLNKHSELYQRLSLFVKSDLDIKDFVFTSSALLQAQLERSRQEYTDREVFKCFKDILGKKLDKNDTKHFMAEVTVDEVFLQTRKEFLLANSKLIPKVAKEKYSHPLLDPEYEMQPIPAVDVAFFEFSEKDAIQRYKEHLKEIDFKSNFEMNENSTSFAQAMKFNEEGKSSQRKRALTFLNVNACQGSIERGTLAEDQLCALLGFQCVGLEKVARDIYRKSFNKENGQYLEAEFINGNFSLGLCKIKKFNDYYLTFIANTTEGSSGSPIVDQNLDIIGVNFGSYFDDQSVPKPSKKEPQFDATKDKLSKKRYFSEQKMPRKSEERIEKSSKIVEEAKLVEYFPKDIFQYDVQIQEPGINKFANCRKNSNLAVNFSHPLLVDWIIKRKLRLHKMNALFKLPKSSFPVPKASKPNNTLSEANKKKNKSKQNLHMKGRKSNDLD